MSPCQPGLGRNRNIDITNDSPTVRYYYYSSDGAVQLVDRGCSCFSLKTVKNIDILTIKQANPPTRIVSIFVCVVSCPVPSCYAPNTDRQVRQLFLPRSADYKEGRALRSANTGKFYKKRGFSPCKICICS